MLNPIYDQLADKVNKEYPQQGIVAIAKVDCDSEAHVPTKYHVNKYPTLKLFRNGILTKREYRGARIVDAMFDFIHRQVQSSVVKLSNPSGLVNLDQKKRFIIGHFDDEQSDNYKTFSKVASLLRDDCNFAASTNKDEFKAERPTYDVVYYRASQLSSSKDEFYSGLLNNHEAFYAWAHEKCVPIIREITFENAEELTDEGLPFLILFHHVDDHQSVALFEREVIKQLRHETSSINCLHADGAKFIHPLQHLGKSTNDLPLLVIDSFRHMFLFPDIKEMSNDDKLLQFVKDLHSGKLHRDFHNPPSPTKKPENIGSNIKGDSIHIPKNVPSQNGDSSGNPSSPPESVFVRLTPSRQRYSFRDEL